MENRLFRQKSVERITSPEQLQDYMKVTSPRIWMVLAAVIAILAGLLISSSLATLESSLPVTAEVEKNVVSVTLPAAQKENVEPGMTLRVAGQTVKIDFIFQEDGDHIVAMGEGKDLPDGAYEAEIVTETITPIKLLMN